MLTPRPPIPSNAKTNFNLGNPAARALTTSLRRFFKRTPSPSTSVLICVHLWFPCPAPSLHQTNPRDRRSSRAKTNFNLGNPSAAAPSVASSNELPAPLHLCSSVSICGSPAPLRRFTKRTHAADAAPCKNELQSGQPRRPRPHDVAPSLLQTNSQPLYICAHLCPSVVPLRRFVASPNELPIWQPPTRPIH